ncbi:MAG: Rv3235 family protein [Micropruina sp.]|uniref:Rv3235 family protein n=1 Tax=Micropruina sp. TaxID=2737536 RepID=UPI0039E4EC7E
MCSGLVVVTPAPVALPPAVRVIEPFVFSDNAQPPLLPWLEPEPPAAPALSEVPDALRRRVGALAAAVAEVLRGRRPLFHLEPHVGAEALELIGGLRAAGVLPQLRLASLRVTQPAPAAIEASARLALGEFSRAAALRLEQDAGDRWLLTELELALDDATVLCSGRPR